METLEEDSRRERAHALEEISFDRFIAPLFIGIAGLSCSGKSLVRTKIQEYYQERGYTVAIISNDNNSSHQQYELLAQDLDALKMNSYSTSVDDEAKHEQPIDIILVEDALILQVDSVRERLDFKIFVDAESDIRFTRLQQRNSSAQAQEEPTKAIQSLDDETAQLSRRYADLIVYNNGSDNVINLDGVYDEINKIMQERWTSNPQFELSAQDENAGLKIRSPISSARGTVYDFWKRKPENNTTSADTAAHFTKFNHSSS